MLLLPLPQQLILRLRLRPRLLRRPLRRKLRRPLALNLRQKRAMVATLSSTMLPAAPRFKPAK